MKLIDKDAVVSVIEKEIETIQAKHEECVDKNYNLGIISTALCIAECRVILSVINTLEVKEVDLEKEINEYIDDEWCDEWSGDVGNWIRYRRGTRSMEVEDIKDIAKYFFELGLQAKKGE